MTIKQLSAAFLLSAACLSSADESGVTELQYYVNEAMNGSAYSQLTIGEAYLLGEKVEQNLVEAYAWLMVASEQQIEEAEALLQQVWDAMTPDQRGHAEALAQYYLQQYLP